MQSVPSNGVEIDDIIILNTTESAKYAYTEITFDNFRLRQSQPRVELSPDGFLLYSSDNSYLKMTPEGIDFRGGQGFTQTSTMLAGETNSDNIDVYGSLAAPSLQAYEADPANATAQAQAGILAMQDKGEISGGQAKEIYEIVLKTGRDPEEIADSEGLKQVSDTGAIEEAIDAIIAANEDKVAEYRGGKDKLFGFFVGQTMKAMQGKANPQVVNELVKKGLAG